MADTIARAALPYTSQPKTGRGIRVSRDGRTVYVAGQPYTAARALELSAAIARAANDTHLPAVERVGTHRG